jgi:hypothetical protein
MGGGLRKLTARAKCGGGDGSSKANTTNQLIVDGIALRARGGQRVGRGRSVPPHSAMPSLDERLRPGGRERRPCGEQRPSEGRAQRSPDPEVETMGRVTDVGEVKAALKGISRSRQYWTGFLSK